MSVFLVPPVFSSDALSKVDALAARLRELRPDLPAPLPLAEAKPRNTPEQMEYRRALTEALRKAAVLGWFRPTRLVTRGPVSMRERVLSDVVSNCEVQGEAGHRLWRLRRDPRREFLTKLSRQPQSLLRILTDTEALSRADADARLLRRVIRGAAVKPASARTDEERASMLRVAEWTERIFDNAPQATEVRALLSRDAVKDSLSLLISRFQGRAAELDTLRAFVAGRSRERTRVPVLGISGIGGVGKSALLARFVDRLFTTRSGRRPGVVLIDFDRARFSSGDPLAMTFELTRQLGAWFPQISESLQTLRRDVRINVWSSSYSTRSESAQAAVESSARGTLEIIERLRPILSRAGIGVEGGRPLVIVLDTFEVLQGRQDEGTQGLRGAAAVIRWTQDLFGAGLSNIRVIVAGRAPISEDVAFGKQLTQPELLLTGLDQDAAVALLEGHGLSPRDARLVVDAVADPVDRTCNPLILRLAARLVKGRHLKASSLKAETAGRAALDQEFVQGILYNRILAHIGERKRDRALAVLAHPGLVLRRVTPDLIKKVLIPNTDLKKQRDLDPVDLFNRLRREVWLVRDAGKDVVEHRTDLRRTMLRLIAVDMQPQATKVHRAAIKYYESGNDKGLNPERAAGEAFYHRLMILDRQKAARIDPASVRRFESTISLTIDDLPPHVLAVVKQILDHPLSDRDGVALPEPHRTRFILQQGERYFTNDEPYRALALLESAPKLHPLWELRALSLTVQWPLARRRGLLRADRKTSIKHEPERLTLASWVSFCLGETGSSAITSSRVLAEAADLWKIGRIPELELHYILRALTYSVAASRARGKEPTLIVPWDALREEQLGTTDIAVEATRLTVVASRHNPSGRVVFSGEALPPSPRLLEMLSASPSLPPALSSQLGKAAKVLYRLPAKASSGYMLGALARSFPKAVVVDAESWPELRNHWKLICPNPEFRGPVKFALLEALTTENDFAMLADAASTLLDVRPQNLRVKDFARRASLPGRAGQEIAALVDFVDRSAALGGLLNALRLNKPRSPKLRLVANAFERWQRVIDPGPSIIAKHR